MYHTRSAPGGTRYRGACTSYYSTGSTSELVNDVKPTVNSGCSSTVTLPMPTLPLVELVHATDLDPQEWQRIASSIYLSFAMVTDGTMQIQIGREYLHHDLGIRPFRLWGTIKRKKWGAFSTTG